MRWRYGRFLKRIFYGMEIRVMFRYDVRLGSENVYEVPPSLKIAKADNRSECRDEVESLASLTRLTVQHVFDAYETASAPKYPHSRRALKSGGYTETRS